MEIGDIKKACKEKAIAGLSTKLYIACYDEVASIPAINADNHTVETDIVMRAADAGATPPIEAGAFASWDFSQKDQTFESEQDEEGGMWNTNVQIFIPATNGVKSAVLNNIGDESSIIIVSDKKGRRRIIGSVELPCEVKVKSQLTPKDGYIVTITWLSAYEPFYYTGAITT